MPRRWPPGSWRPPPRLPDVSSGAVLGTRHVQLDRTDRDHPGAQQGAHARRVAGGAGGDDGFPGRNGGEGGTDERGPAARAATVRVEFEAELAQSGDAAREDDDGGISPVLPAEDPEVV